MRRSKNKTKLYFRKTAIVATAAVLAPVSSQAFVISPPKQSLAYPSQSRLYSSGRDDNNSNNEGGLLSGLKNVAKSILPSSWFQSEQEKKAAIQRQRMQDEVQGSLKEILKDAPFPVRMMGNLMGPLMSSGLAGLAETMADQQDQVNAVLSESKSYLLSDPAVADLLGDGPIQVGTPFSQSTSTSSINGRTTSRVELSFPVTGSRSAGVAQAVAGNGRVEGLRLQVDSRIISVSLLSKTPRSSAFRSSDGGPGDIIEAEIIEKNTNK